MKLVDAICVALTVLVAGGAHAEGRVAPAMPAPKLGQAASATEARPLKVGQPAPPFDALLLSGEPFSLDSAKDHVLLIQFWATWCPPCRTEMPVLDAYYRKHRSEGLKMVLISVDDPFEAWAVRKYMAPFSLPVGMAHDASFEGYGRIWRIPLTFVIDRKGILRRDAWLEDASIEEADLEQIITPLLRQH